MCFMLLGGKQLKFLCRGDSLEISCRKSRETSRKNTKILVKTHTFLICHCCSTVCYINPCILNCFPPLLGQGLSYKSPVKTEKIRKWRIWVGLRDIWRIFVEILPLQKIKGNSLKNDRNCKKNLRITNTTIAFLICLCFCCSFYYFSLYG